MILMPELNAKCTFDPTSSVAAGFIQTLSLKSADLLTGGDKGKLAAMVPHLAGKLQPREDDGEVSTWQRASPAVTRNGGSARRRLQPVG